MVILSSVPVRYTSPLYIICLNTCITYPYYLLISSQTEYCQCGSNLEVTETAAKQIYTHMGFVDGRSTMTAEGYRMDTVHVWGTHNLSTSDLLRWLKRFDPKGVEWIDDSSCKFGADL